jgi:hypothetical protein
MTGSREVRLVVNPVEVHAKSAEQLWIDAAAFRQRRQRRGDQAGQLTEALRALATRDVIEVEDHRGTTAKCTSASV